ncbi:CAP domain-containing protein [Halomicroarcula sp. F28]|uniref:CAP domain-containing protein n=1 Tax=Haloarcula salinisoli TaxID=2487746 RepID=UPI001C7333F5|nr:CAP domain-containing protein [Halomicroarcula salinisoli]MBX0288467.1 CAP domain-containing protein [Halomicroarcula salinisoli]
MAKLGVLAVIVLVVVSILFGTGIPAIDDSVDGIAPNSQEAAPESQQNAAGVNTTNVERLVHQEINDRRTANGLDPIAYDPALASIAEDHSQDMITRDFFAHENPDGDNFDDRYDQAGYDCRVATGGGTYATGGENIAQTWWDEQISTTQGPVRYDTEAELAEGIVTQWMNSTGHRENILTDHWESEGIGVSIAEDDEVLVTQNFC